ncbi:MAG: hypothetical protein L6Q59_10355 [Ignavibacteriaceae bacterium]|nr:hypothetical protein [Ignavibacteriaceae bacterium]
MKHFLILIFALGILFTANIMASGRSDGIASIKPDKINHDADTGRVSDDDFRPVLDSFLEKCFFGNNYERLLMNEAPEISDFIHPVIGVRRYYNPGAFGFIAGKEEGYGFYNPEQYLKYDFPLSEMAVFDLTPENGFCEESGNENGVYYFSEEKFPEVADMETLESIDVTLPAGFIPSQIMRVNVLFEGWRYADLWFAQVEGKWYLVFIDGRDCSA